VLICFHGSFLNDIERIGRRSYEPSDEDVVRARLRTLGVQQYNFFVESMGHEWQIFDVGGSRSTVSRFSFQKDLRLTVDVSSVQHGIRISMM
jgi:hypothetical protein